MRQAFKKAPFVLALLFSSLFLINNATAAPKYGWPGCPHVTYSSPLIVIVEYYSCWNCPSQPFGLGCNGDCAKPCATATDREQIDEEVWLIQVYDDNGNVTNTFNASSWTEESISIGGSPGTRLTFTIAE